ncbi:MAG: trigger factor [Muribaculaceae bacterium]|nr:trigger factor [Muribaculaceae bacterium]MBQ3960173.1 trigger factor [Muribaculaceae bacterium]
MNVTFDKKDNVNALLTVSLTPEDYLENEKKELLNISRKHPMKGFRPGHVPMSLLKKQYGIEVRSQVVDRMVGKALTDYIVNEKIDILGEPMLSADTRVDLNQDTNYEFKFDLGLAPEFELKLDKRVKIPYYNIKVTDEMVENQNASYKKRFGKQVPGEAAAEDSLLKGSMVELDENDAAKEGGVSVDRTIISPQFLKNADEKAKFIGKKVGESIVFNPHTAADGNLTELAAMLNVDKSEADIKSNFKFNVEEILVNQDAEMDQELFDNVLGKDVAKTEEEYREKLREMISNQLKNDSNYRFTVDAERVLKKKVGNLELPEEFLKRFLQARSKEQDEKKFDEQFPQTLEQLKWQLIKEKVARTYDVKVELEDKLRLARFYAAQQFAQYGMTNLPDEVIDKYAHEFLEKREYSEEIQNRAFEDKVFAAIKANVGIDEKEVSVEEFNKLFEK